jgi:hypothetical protein
MQTIYQISSITHFLGKHIQVNQLPFLSVLAYAMGIWRWVVSITPRT